MLAAFAFHRVGSGKHATSLEQLEAHLSYIKERFTVVLPGDPLAKRRLSVLLSFDDATFDFYRYVYPLLRRLNLRALLGVPVRYIQESTSLADSDRLGVHYTMMMQDGIFDSKVPFCTWQELAEMTSSGHVEVASHSYSHANLTFPFVDLERECLLSKEIIQKRLDQAVTSFVYPFGRLIGRSHSFVQRHYAYAFRLGGGYNFGWQRTQSPLLRIPADSIPHLSSLFSIKARLSFLLKGLT